MNTDIYEPKWILYVKKLIDNCGFSYFWDQQNVLNNKYMISSLHSKIDDLAKQEWFKVKYSLINFLVIIESSNAHLGMKSI